MPRPDPVGEDTRRGTLPDFEEDTIRMWEVDMLCELDDTILERDNGRVPEPILDGHSRVLTSWPSHPVQSVQPVADTPSDGTPVSPIRVAAWDQDSSALTW